MAAAIQDALGVTAELVEGDGGVFDLEVDDRIVFSKKDAGRFVEVSEALELIEGVGG